MSSLRYLIFGCFILLALSEFADGLKCYSCSNCNSPFELNNGVYVTSNDPKNSCSKTIARNGDTVRGMMANCAEDNKGGIGTWCCNKDLCNGAIPTTSSLCLVFTIATVVVTMLT